MQNAVAATFDKAPTMRFLESWPELAWVILAIMGGIARYLDSYLKSGQAPKFGLLIGHALVSGFSGYMIAQVMLKLNPDWALIAAGIGGYVGTQALDWVAEAARNHYKNSVPGPAPHTHKNNDGKTETHTHDDKAE